MPMARPVPQWLKADLAPELAHRRAWSAAVGKNGFVCTGGAIHLPLVLLRTRMLLAPPRVRVFTVAVRKWSDGTAAADHMH